MKKKMFKSSVSLCLVVVFLMSLAVSPVAAGPPEHAGPPEDAGPPDHSNAPEHAGPHNNIDKINLSEDAIDEAKLGVELSQYVNYTEDTLVFDYESALDDGYDKDNVLVLKEDIDKINKSNIDIDKIKNSFRTFSSQPSILSNSLTECSTCGTLEGQTMDFNDLGWFEYTYLYICSCTTEEIIALLKGGAGVLTIATFIPDASSIPTGVAAAIAGIGTAALEYHNAGSTGIKVNIMGPPINGPYYFSSQ